jgi:hypothetical protein
LINWQYQTDGKLYSDFWFLRSEENALKFTKDLVAKHKSKIIKKDKERNLRALASEKTSKTRQVAKSQRSKVNFDEQVGVYKNCPYCPKRTWKV